MNLDKSTGLPALPDGYFWRVEAESLMICRRMVSGWYFGFQGVWSEHANVAEHYNTESRVAQRKIPKWWGHKLEPRTEHRDHYAIWVARSRFSPTGQMWLSGMGGMIEVPKMDFMDAENLPERAAALYEEWQDRLEREKVYGNYPPKKLEES